MNFEKQTPIKFRQCQSPIKPSDRREIIQITSPNIVADPDLQPDGIS